MVEIHGSGDLDQEHYVLALDPFDDSEVPFEEGNWYRIVLNMDWQHSKASYVGSKFTFPDSELEMGTGEVDFAQFAGSGIRYFYVAPCEWTTRVCVCVCLCVCVCVCVCDYHCINRFRYEYIACYAYMYM